MKFATFFPALTKLSIDDKNQFNELPGYLVKGLRARRYLRVLQLTNCRAGHDTYEELEEAFRSMPFLMQSLQELRIAVRQRKTSHCLTAKQISSYLNEANFPSCRHFSFVYYGPVVLKGDPYFHKMTVDRLSRASFFVTVRINGIQYTVEVDMESLHDLEIVYDSEGDIF